jgi:hypothetical protein
LPSGPWQAAHFVLKSVAPSPSGRPGVAGSNNKATVTNTKHVLIRNKVSNTVFLPRKDVKGPWHRPNSETLLRTTHSINPRGQLPLSVVR